MVLPLDELELLELDEEEDDPPVFREYWSKFGPPSAVLAVSLIVLLPAFKVTECVTVLQVFQLPVPGKVRLVPAPPFTLTAQVRLAVDPFA